MKNVMPAEFVAFDIETTGLDAKKDDIIELAGVLFKNGEPSGEFATFIKTDKKVPPHITILTGIKNEDLEGGQDLATALFSFFEFAGKRPMVAHNSSFDVKFLNEKMGSLKKGEVKNVIYDTLLLARLGIPDQPSYKLENLSKVLNVHSGTSHRAKADADACGKIFVHALTSISRFPDAKLHALGRLVGKHETETAKLLRSLVPETAAKPARRRFKPQPEPLVASDTAQTVDEHEIECVFINGGLLSQELEAYEFRPGQLAMAHAVRRAFNDRELLVAEAGTGTGKSLAYLIAAIYFAVKNGVRVAISTRTKALQDQIFQKEIPFLAQRLDVEFRATLLKGRSNYVCLRKWHELLRSSHLLLRGREADNILPLIPWIEETESGDVAECLGFNEKENRIIWAKIASDHTACLGNHCPYFNECFVMRKRREALSSHIVVVNHALFFTDLKSDGSLLGRLAHVIFDEAHSLEDVGRKHLGDEASHVAFSTALQKLHQKDEEGHGLLRYIEKILGKAQGRKAADLLKDCERLTDMVSLAEMNSVKFFRSLGAALRKKGGDKQRFTGTLADAVSLKGDMLDLGGFIALLKTFESNVGEIAESNDELKNAFFDLASAVHDIASLYANFLAIIRGEDDSSIFWTEAATNPINTKIFRAPLEIASIFKERFLSLAQTAVFTSATLAVNRDFAYFRERVGITGAEAERSVQTIVDSPFRMGEQVRFCTAKGIDAPDSAGYPAQVADIITRLAGHGRNILALFTSREMLRNVYAHLAESFLAQARPLFAQDITGPGYQLVEEMKKNPGAVLLGTDSFWEGIDLPGEHLEILIIARLPFGVPADPIVQARAEACEKRGENAFMRFYLPDAVIKFRQGVGRLIRREKDHGAAIVLDGRIIEKSYGSFFKNSVGSDLQVYSDRETLLARVGEWFEGKR